MTIDIVERLNRRDIIAADGEIHSIADANDLDITESNRFPMTDEERVARMHARDPYEADVDRYYEQVDAEQRRQDTITIVRERGYFAERNGLLVEATKSAGRSKKHEGAAAMFEDGRFVPGYDGSAKIAETAAANARESSLKLIRQACGVCALQELCLTKPEELADELLERDTRNRFRERVKKEMNDQLCEDNASPARLKK